MFKVKIIQIKDLEYNSGQIPDVPKNPRFIKDHKYAKLMKSIEDDPKFLDAREPIVYLYEGQYIILCGNMRVRAMVELGHMEAKCKIAPSDSTAKELRGYIIKDNQGYGEDDFEILANEYDLSELIEFGYDEEEFGITEIEPEKKTSDEKKDDETTECSECGQIIKNKDYG